MSEDTWRWLASTRHLQETAFGVDYSQLTGEKLADYMLENAFALSDELHEAMAEFKWKSWAKDRGCIDKAAFLGEMVDLGHFFANMLVAAGITDDEYEAAYREKQRRNVARQAADGGYDAVATKCPRCGRELDKPGNLAITTIQPDSGQPAMRFVICVSCRMHVAFTTGEVVNWLSGIRVPDIITIADVKRAKAEAVAGAGA